MTIYYIDTTHHLNIKAKGNISTNVSKVLFKNVIQQSGPFVV